MMDTSKEYIKMCEKGKRFIPDEVIEGLDDNTFWAQEHRGEYVIGVRGPIPSIDIPLFRQDQLQEMILNFGSHGYSNAGILQHLSMFSYENKLNRVSMEQLWLAFLYSEKYNKYWDGSNWILKK